MPEVLLEPELQKQSGHQFNPEKNQVEDLEKFLQGGLQDAKNEINAIARTTLNKKPPRHDLFGVQISELYIKLLEVINISARNSKEQKDAAKFLKAVDMHIGTKMQPAGHSFGSKEAFAFRRDGILAEYASMRVFQKYLKRTVIMDSDLDTSYKIDFQVAASAETNLLIQVKSSNDLGDVFMVLGKDASSLSQDAIPKLRSVIRPNRSYNLASVLDEQKLQHMFDYVEKQKGDNKKYIPLALALPSVGMFDEFGEPSGQYVTSLGQKLTQEIARYKKLAS